MTDRLSEFGYTFQIKIITCLFNDRNFLQQSLDILDPMFFENESNQYIVRIIKEYFTEYKSPPTMEVMKVKLADIDDGLLRSTIVDNMKESLRFLGSDDLDFIMERTIEGLDDSSIRKSLYVQL